jgi:serine/threonine protein kinase
VENGLELLSVTTLRHRLDTGGPLSLSEASAIIDRLAVILDSLHLKGQIHGAVNPGNILLLPQDQIQLLSPKTTQTKLPMAARSGRTFAGDTLYLSPEEARGDAPTAATDIWCLGALLYEMLTGFPPFIALRLAKLQEMVVHNEPDLLPQTSAVAQLVVDAALAKWPANRFVSAQDLANKLWAIAPSQHVPVGIAASTSLLICPTLSLKQAVNRSLSTTSTALDTNRTRGWMRFFGGRRQSSNTTA